MADKLIQKAVYPPRNQYDLAYQETEKILSEIEAEVESVYGQAYNELKATAEEFLEQFRKADELKRKAVEDGKISNEEYQRWRRTQMMQGRQHYAMMQTIADNLANKNGIAYSIINGYIPEVYAINGNFMTYKIEKHFGINTVFTLYNEQAVERLISAKPDLLPLPRVNIPKDKAWNKANINSAITQGIIQGENIDSIAKRLANVANMNRSQSLRVAATATTNAQNAGRYEAMYRAVDLGVEGVNKTWLATLDSHTRPSHRHTDGEVRKLDEKFSNGLLYPGDANGEPAEVYNCRCCLNSFFSDTELYSLKDRFSRLPKNMSYDEWKNAHGGEPFFKRGRNAGTDFKMYEEYSDLYKEYRSEFNAKMPDSFTAFQDYKYNNPTQWKRMIQDARRARNRKQS